MVKALLEASANLCATNSIDFTPVHLAAQNGQVCTACCHAEHCDRSSVQIPLLREMIERQPDLDACTKVASSQ